MRRGLLAGAISTILVLSTAHASADTLSALRSTAVVEKSHVVSVEMGHGHARLVVRRNVFNGGARHDQATFLIDPPPGAVATGLRTRSMEGGVERWFTADLLDAELAAKRYTELTGIGGYYPKDPALLSWRPGGQLMLQVFPVGPREDKMIEYTFTLPTSYSDGRDRLSLPVMGTATRAAELTARPADARDRVFAGAAALAPGARVPPDEGGFHLALARGRAPGLGGALAVVPFGPGRVLLRQRIEAAARLGEAPRGARLVVILDVSRSLSASDVADEVAAARAYLSHFADAEAEVLLVDRRVTALEGRFVGAKDAAAALGRRSITRGNGSNVDAALTRAAELFAPLPAHTPRRIVLLTDTRTRASLSTAHLRKLASTTGAVIHVGVIRGGTPRLERDDRHPWAQVARATGGLAWSAIASAADDESGAMREVYEEWVRPRRIDHLRVTVPGLSAEAFGYPAVLGEGEGFADMRIVRTGLGFVKIEGELWSRPIEATLVPGAEEGRVAAALAIGELLPHLSEREVMTLAWAGHAVSPMTSLLAVEPGVRPSTEGIERGNMWGDSIGDSFGVGALGLTGIGEGGGGASPEPDRARWLKSELAPVVKACGAERRRARTVIETTLAEVVDVTTTVDGTNGARLARCVEEGAWALELPGVFNHERARFDLAL